MKWSQIMSDSICPICNTKSEHDVANSPYHSCMSCGLWFQYPLPPKTYEAAHEKDENGGFRGHLMSDHEKEVNANLTKWLFDNYVKGPGRTLDVGSKYPYLAHCLKNLGCNAFGMDNIEIVPEYSKELDVPMLMADFEKISDEQISRWVGMGLDQEKFKLITMVHVFEHMYDPLETLKKLRKLVADDGFVYIRSPNNSVTGFERDMTPGHFTIHPYFHSFSSILELLVQTKDLFVCDFYFPLQGAGQSDWILRPITKKPIIYAGLIVKNEERDLPKCLESIKDVVDGVVIVDTGSTDNTEGVAKKTWNETKKPIWFSQYFDASEKDENGDWKLWNFSKARNVYVKKIEEYGADWCLWMDADDILIAPKNLKRAVYFQQYSIFGFQIDAGGPLWTHHRMWRTGLGIKYDFPIHEYPTIGGHSAMTLSDVIIKHDAAPTFGETGNERNLRILEREWQQNPTSRVAFYLANTHNDGGRKAEAEKWYQKRIDMGEHYKDEMLFAYLYLARVQRALQNQEGAKKTLLEATSRAPNWSEFWTELSYIAYDQKNWGECIGYATVALSQTSSYTQLWREENKYTDQPARMISWCHEHLGQRKLALEWAHNAKKHIKGVDKDWDDRIARLMKRRAAFVRAGAIGDVVMTLRLIPEFKKKNPNVEVHYFTNTFIANELKWLMQQVGVDEAYDVNTYESLKDNFDQSYVLIGYPLNEGYPEKPMKKHLVQYFAAEMGLEEKPEDQYVTKVDLPVLSNEWKIVPKGYATIQAKTGWSVYKEWPIDRWAEVVKNLDIPIIQIGASDDPKIPGAIHDYLGRSLQDAIILFANSKFHMGVDSFPNHLSGFVWGEQKVHSLIVWGSTQPSASGYNHNVNICRYLWCSPCFRENPKISKMSRGPCINPQGQVYEQPNHACMMGIDTNRVLDGVRQLLTLIN